MIYPLNPMKKHIVDGEILMLLVSDIPSCCWFRIGACATCVWLHGGFFLASLERNQRRA